MDFSRLCAKAQIWNAKLIVAVRAEDPIEEISAQFQRLSELGESIMAHRPADRRELDEMTTFFARRAAASPSRAAARRDYEKIASLLELFPDGFDSDPPAPEDETPEHPAGRADDDVEALAERVASEPERLILAGPDHRIMAASWTEALFHGRRPAQLAGRHLGEILGFRQFERGFRPRLQRLFTDGPAVEYAYRSAIQPRRPLMIQIHGQPVLDERNRVILASLRSSEAAQRPSRA